MPDTKVLEEIGLTEGEIKIYLALLKIGASKSGLIMKEASMTNSSTYRCLESLMDKGLVNYIIKNNVKYFQAADPKSLLKLLDEKKAKISEMLPSLIKKEEEGQEARIYEGFKAITTAYEECLEELKPGDESLFFSIGEEDLSDKNIQTFFMNLSLKRKARKIGMRGIAPLETREIFKKYPVRIDMRYTDIKLPTGVSIYKNSIIIISWKDKPTAIIIKSRNITESYRNFFEDAWKLAKK